MKKYSTLVVLLSSVLLFSCRTAKMSVSDELKSSNDEYAVKGKNGTRIKQKMSFGNYATTNIQRSWVKGNSSRAGIGYYEPARDEWVNIISTEYIRRKQTIRFKLNQGNHNSEVYCVSRFNAKNLQIGRSTNSVLNIGMEVLGIGGASTDNYYVQIFATEQDDRPWEMVIDNQMAQSRPKEYIGYLSKGGSEYYSIVPVTRMETAKKSGNILAGAIGFEFRDPQGHAVAAVSMLDGGTIYLGKLNPTDRFLLANACTALLLQDVIG